MQCLDSTPKSRWYEKVGERPLVYLFASGNDGAECQLRTAAEIRKAAEMRGMRQPFIVPMNRVQARNGERNNVFDAVSRYALGIGDVTNWKDFSDRVVEQNESLKQYGRPIVPAFSAGWNPRPRIVCRVPWCEYSDIPYILPDKGDFRTEMSGLKRWIDANRSRIIDHMMVFAWNEFEEGGWLCPTKGRDGTINTTRIEEFRKALALLHRPERVATIRHDH